MSVDDEPGLKDLLMQTLTENGCLAKIKAQLRASVFLALEEDLKLSSKTPLLNEKVKTFLHTSEGQLMFSLVKEFLEFFNLQSTMTVFDAESYLGDAYHYGGRSKVMEDLGLTVNNNTVPLLNQVVQLAQEKSKVLEVNFNVAGKEIHMVDNNSSNSEKTVETESIINGEFSDSNSNLDSLQKANGSNSLSEEASLSIRIPYQNDDYKLNGHSENGPDINLNKTFITEPSVTSKNPENTMDFTFDSQNSVKELSVNSTQHIMLPLSISDKIDEITMPVLKDLKLSPERVKSPKSDKFKSKNSLNSLSDLPPLNINKNRSGTILPSLYSKEFKEKPNS